MLPLSMIVAIGNNGAIGYKGKYHGIFLKTCLILKNYPRSCNNYGKKDLE